MLLLVNYHRLQLKANAYQLQALMDGGRQQMPVLDNLEQWHAKCF